MAGTEEPSGAEVVSALDGRQAITIEELRDLIPIGRRAAYEAVERGDIPSVRIGRRVFIPVAALNAMLGVPAPGDGSAGVDLGSVEDVVRRAVGDAIRDALAAGHTDPA